MTIIQVWVVGDSNDLEVRFGHREASVFDLESIDVGRVFNIVVNDGNV